MCPFFHFDSLAQFALGVCSFCIEEVDPDISLHPMGKRTTRPATPTREVAIGDDAPAPPLMLYTTHSRVILLDRFSGLLVMSRVANCPRCRDPNTSPDYSIGRSDGQCVQRAGT
ncbi:hypothetical protein PVK06_026614 [Gossypium arboreum]|uniref:Uncharacterized protein n=1 Tax=Gossypium arboreum TaxID=29729 RepID=A0ABR0P1L3_GOSAR|nr:hypothetical protein PVK06_026614 [Gossypium arboreum]